MESAATTNRFELTGKITHRYDQRNPAPNFRVREFIMRVTDTHPIRKDIEEQFIKFQLVNKACDWLKDFRAGHYVRVRFRLTGRVREYQGEPSCFTNLEVLEMQYETGESEEQDDQKPVTDTIYMKDIEIPEEQLADMDKAKEAAEKSADDIFGDDADANSNGKDSFDDLPF